MQETRHYILEILRESGQATVDDIVDDLRKRRGDNITAVTVRHHLKELHKDEFITAPQLRHRDTPGRPQHVYMLTDKAKEYFPNNYQRLALALVEQLRAQLPADGINVIIEGVATSMAVDAHMAAHVDNLPIHERLEVAVNYLNQHGYSAFWETTHDGYILHTRNCPYHQVAQTTHVLCDMDMRLVASLIGVVPRMLARVSRGDATCAYLIPVKTVS